MSQPGRFCLIFGIVAGVGFIGTWLVLRALLPNYDPITQTISEIGEKGSPFEMPFKIANLFVAGCFVLFSYGVYRFSVARQLSLVPAFLLGFFAVTQLGVSTFESPHPWHNLFGISSMLGFFAPLGLAVTWPSTSDLRVLRTVSLVVAVLILIAIALNLSPLFIQVPYIVEHIGLVQRSLPVFHLWCAYLATILFRNAGELTHSGIAREMG
jgi:hypothetical membrane protein